MLLSSPHKSRPGYIEGRIQNVDPNRFIASVLTVNGKLFHDVTWLLPTGGSGIAGTHIAPNVGEKVLVSTVLGYPLIIGSIPEVAVPLVDAANLTGSASTSDVGTDSYMGAQVKANPGAPTDFIPGDFVHTTKGGSMIGILTSGLAILKTSTLSQIVLSRFEGLARIVARNYQRFSDASSNTATNMKGRLFEFFGADWSATRNRNSEERYREVYGDVAAGEVLGSGFDPTTVLPATDNRVKQVSLADVNNNIIRLEQLNQDGSIVETVRGINQATTFVKDEASGSCTWIQSNYAYVGAATSGSGKPGSVYLTVGSTTGFTVGNTIFIQGAGASGANLSAVINGINGNVFTLSVPLISSTNGLVVASGTTQNEARYYTTLSSTTGAVTSFHSYSTVWSSLIPTVTDNGYASFQATTANTQVYFGYGAAPGQLTISNGQVLLTMNNTSTITMTNDTMVLSNQQHSVTINSTGIAII